MRSADCFFGRSRIQSQRGCSIVSVAIEGLRTVLCVLVAMLMFSSAVGIAVASDSRWTQMTPAPAPSARLGHDMAYDAESDRVILFGGETAPGSNVLNNETWAYDLNSNTWENRNPSPSPSSRFAHAMVYDTNSDRVILFGGWTGTKQSNETWAYDYNTNTWTNMTPATSPPTAVFVEMAYDAESDRAILFGGAVDRDGNGGSSETWAYDFDSNHWTRMSPGASPAARGIHGMAYEPTSDRVILFGGRDPGKDFGDTWAYDYNNDGWTERKSASAPSPRHGVSLAYDATSDGVVFFGGVTVTGDPFGGDETWVYNFKSDTWRQVEKGGSGPSARFGAGMATDVESVRIVLFGGSFGGGTWTGGGWRVSTPSTDLTLVFEAIAVGAGAIAAAVGILLWRKRRVERKQS